jgi:hypothetical protein
LRFFFLHEYALVGAEAHIAGALSVGLEAVDDTRQCDKKEDENASENHDCLARLADDDDGE